MTFSTEPIIKQTEVIQSAATKLQLESDANERRYEHMHERFSLMKLVNTVLVYFYLLLFTTIHVLFFEQYLVGVPRSEFWDTIWLTVFFLYPYLIFLIEYYIYEGVMYISSLIHSKIYVPGEFHAIVTGVDMYNAK